MLHIVIGSLVIHLVDIACLTESQKLDPDKAVHIMHITVGTSTVHLVGKKSAMEFDMFNMSLYEEDMGLLNQAGYIHILGDGEEVHAISPPNWESL